MYLMLMLIVVLATSCSNDEIEIVKEDPVHVLTYNVSTQPAFDKLGVTEEFKSRYLGGDNSYQIGVYTFIYDQDGMLVTSDSTYIKTFTKVSQTFDLQSGEYTAITLEMLVDADDSNQSDYWYITGKEKQSTLEIVQKVSEMYYGAAVGVSTVNLNINGNLSTEVTPSAMGAIIQVAFKNFDKSDYTWVSFDTKNAPIGRYLSPLLNGTERFHYDKYLGSNTWTPRGSVYKSAGIDASDGLSIYMMEEGSIQYGLAASTVTSEGSVNDCFLYPDNGDAYLGIIDGSTYYGGLWYTGNGGSNDCQGFVGTKREYETWLSNTDRTVNKGNFSYKEPYVKWGSSVASVQSFMSMYQSVMSKYTMTVGTNGTAVAQSDGSYGLKYSGVNNETAIQYFFTSATTGLFESDLFFDKTKYSIDVIKSSMSGKTLLAEKNGTYMYASSDSKSYIIIFEDGDYNIIGYVDVNYLASSNVKAQSRSNTNTSKAIEHINSMRYLLK